MRTPINFIRIACMIALLNSGGCKQKLPADAALLTDQNLLHRNIHHLTQVIIYDVFSPPVSSRIYAYTSLAAYEALRFQDSSKPSIVASLQGFAAMPQPEKGKAYNYLLAATKAYFTVAQKVTFSIDTLKKYEATVYQNFKALLPEDVYNRSIAFGEKTGQQILVRTTLDNYRQTRGMSKFLGSDAPGQWRPTPPDYLDAAEPHWGKMKPLALDSATQFKCPRPPSYTTDTASPFYTTAKEVHNITTNLTDEQKQIARYWDDNPFVMEHAGHLMFGNKKITPVGHWMGITTIACKEKKANAVQTAQAYALTSVAIFDAIISCWKTKFEYNHIRPITVINESIDRGWQPLLQTPPFPEHPSGHSGISASAATVLTKLFGDNMAFEDTSDLEYIGMKRNFSSFNQAAAEASISRVYGGIHYRTGVDGGAVQGKQVGEFVTEKFLK
ncbi:MAG TPA: vanadium-dependent haloperoxidase [Flavisolibacter sp.]|nr:vanadium-dependent haloperoxidase [Flavisolibacter sp.]